MKTETLMAIIFSYPSIKNARIVQSSEKHYKYYVTTEPNLNSQEREDLQKKLQDSVAAPFQIEVL